MQITRRHFTHTALLATACSVLMPINALGQSTPLTYIVQHGDTLGHIALKHGTSTASLRKANNLTGDLIRVGQKLKIPISAQPRSAQTALSTNATHIVTRGDTLGSIALVHGISTMALRNANNVLSHCKVVF